MKKCIRERCPRKHNTAYKECPNCLDRARRYHQRLRIEVINQYGGKCVCCNERRHEFLAIDHPLGNGSVHRRKVGAGRKLYLWLKRRKFPKGFQVMCNNCNQALGNYGYCPHHPEIKREVRKNAGTRIR